MEFAFCLLKENLQPANGQSKAAICFPYTQEKKLKLNETVKTFPRTLDEAFPYGPDYGCALVHYRDPFNKFFQIGCAMAVVSAFVLVLVWSFK
jgi:hypothetical protein